MPASPAMRTVAPLPSLHRVEHAPERLELADAADEDVARANLHLGQYGAETTVRQCSSSITQPEDTAPSRQR